MRQVLLAVAVGVILYAWASVAYAAETCPIVITEATATGGWDKVTFDRGAIACIIKARTSTTTFQISGDAAGLTSMTFNAGSAFTLSSGTIGARVVWVKATAGQVIEILQQKEG